MNYNNKKFRIVNNSDNGDLSTNMIFHYQQNENILSCNYIDQNIIAGHLLGTVQKDGIIHMSYHQINSHHELLTGICTSTPHVLENGKIQLHEKWQWTNGDKSSGSSILEEI